MRYIKKVFYYAKYLLTLVLFLFCILVLCYALPNNGIRGNIANSISILEQEGEYFSPYLNSQSVSLDNFTDAIILNTALDRDELTGLSVFKRAVSNGRYMSKNSQIKQLKYAIATMGLKSNISYERYWFGSLIIFRPLLMFFDIIQIRFILNIVISVLLLLSLYEVAKRIGKKYSIALLISILLMNYYVIPMSLQYSPVMILTLSSIIYICKIPNNDQFDKKCNFVFITLGALTAYFDLLTYPLFTLIGLVILMLIKFKEDTCNFKKMFLYLVKYSLIWSLSYFGTYLMKWILASIILNNNCIFSSFSSFLGRTGESINRFQVIKNNFNLYFNSITLNGLLLYTIIIITIFILKNSKKIPLSKVLILLILMLYPYAWYSFLANHSLIHSFFTYRIQSITLFSYLSMTLLLLEKNDILISDSVKDKYTFVILAYKESKYLEECIKSVVNQSIETNVVIATSTRNNYILSLAKKYKLEIIENKGKKGIANDFNFAVNCVDTELITIAHQDDIYDKNYAKEVYSSYLEYKDSLIIFSDYFEIRNGKNVYNNNNLNIKKGLLSPLLLRNIAHFRFIKRLSIRFGNAICCPGVTFCRKNIHTENLFTSDFTSNMDWMAWEKISNQKGRFTYINLPLMGHRVHDDSTTTKIINDGKRSEEDYKIFIKFWPKLIAKILTKIYKKSERSNEVK